MHAAAGSGTPMRRITLWLSWLLMFVVALEDLVQAGPLGTLGRVVAIPVSPTDTTGVPPCLGAPGSTGHISMHAWQI